MRTAGLALLLVLDLLEVLLAGPHLRVLELLHVEGLTVSQQLLALVLQLQGSTAQQPLSPLASPRSVSF